MARSGLVSLWLVLPMIPAMASSRRSSHPYVIFLPLFPGVFSPGPGFFGAFMRHGLGESMESRVRLMNMQREYLYFLLLVLTYAR
jgi:hypothetical protein